MDEGRAQFLRRQGATWFQSGLVMAALDAWQRWLQYEETRAASGYSKACLAVGTAWLEAGDRSQAAYYYRRGLEQGPGDVPEDVRAKLLSNLALVRGLNGQYDEAVKLARDATASAGRSSPPELVGHIHIGLSAALMGKQEWQAAVDASRRALEACSHADDVAGMASAYLNLGIALVELGHLTEGEVAIRKALPMASHSGNTWLLAYGCTEMGRLCMRRGAVGGALKYGIAALELLWANIAILDEAEVARLCRLFALIYAAKGDRQQALHHLQRAGFYFAKSQLWREWADVNRLTEQVAPSYQQTSAYRLPDKGLERLQYFTTLLGLLDSLETAYPEIRRNGDLVTKYALLLAGNLGLGRNDRLVMSHAGRLHDVGLTAVDADVVHNGADRSEVAMRRLRAHALLGEELIRMFPLPAELGRVVRHHHERYDGTGYPDGLAGTEIPLLSRVLSLADAYVSRASCEREGSDESVPNGLSAVKVAHEEAADWLRSESGKRFDPDLVDQFLRMHEV